MVRTCYIRFSIWVFPVFSLSLWNIGPVSADPDQIEFFEKKIRPVLVEHCYECHSSESRKIKGGLLLDTQKAMLEGGDTGPALVPKEPAKSLLLKALKYDELEMPPKGKLSEAIIQDFETWIKNGAVDPRTTTKGTPSSKGIDLEAAKQFWSFQMPKSHAAPHNQNAIWSKKKIDTFILSKLEAASLSPNAPADKRTLIRRLYFDLIGLPPNPQEVERFVCDSSPSGVETLVDDLLSRPQYGERWARLWLDVARYAEDQAHIVGNDISLTYPNAYLYRDWVIQALNQDQPYDQFIRLQLAADLIEGQDSKNIAALGFIGLGPKYYARGSLAVMADEWEDRVDVIGRGLLGLTVACARCHDHKFDPIRTEDYYSLAGIFASTRMFNRPLTDKVEKKNDEAKLPKDAMHIVQEGKATDLNIFIRGDVFNKGATATRRFLPILSDSTTNPFTQGSGRKELAEAITNLRNPLTARVIVNRIWAQHFGRGLVNTPSNFGSLGDRPTHPELLDDLAVRFMENGWSLKWLHREIVLSSTYQQSSRSSTRSHTIDPENLLLSHMPRKKLSIESWRDSLLTVSGQIQQEAIGGASIDPMNPDNKRRTIYSHISRLELNRLLAMFDFPDPNVTSEKRSETTTPLQKLFVLNSPFMVSQVSALTDRLWSEIPTADDANTKRIQRAYQLLFARSASEIELQIGLEFLNRSGDAKARWKQYTHVLLASNEMLFLD